MEIIRDNESKKIYIIDNEQVILQTGKLWADFIIHLHTKNKIIIIKDFDECLYFNLKSLLENSCFFRYSDLSYQTDNKIVWFSVCYCDIEDEEERSTISRLIIENVDNKIQISFVNPFYEKYNIDRDGVIAFSPAGNGFYSRNKKTGLTFQDDVVSIFYKILVKDYVKTKKKVKNN